MVCQGHPNWFHFIINLGHQVINVLGHQVINILGQTQIMSQLRLFHQHSASTIIMRGGVAPHSVLASSAPLSRPKYTAVIKCLVSECHQTSRLRRSSIYSRNLFSSSLGLNVISEIRFIAFVIFIR